MVALMSLGLVERVLVPARLGQSTGHTHKISLAQMGPQAMLIKQLHIIERLLAIRARVSLKVSLGSLGRGRP